MHTLHDKGASPWKKQVEKSTSERRLTGDETSAIKHPTDPPSRQTNLGSLPHTSVPRSSTRQCKVTDRKEKEERRRHLQLIID